MTEEIIIDVSNCSHKRDDECMEVPICNEYGDLMGYQSCEAQTLCPYRSQKKIERLEQECDELKKTVENQKLEYEEAQCDINTLVADNSVLYKQIGELKQENEELVKARNHFMGVNLKYFNALEEIREMCNKHLDAKEICYAAQVIDKINEVIGEN